MSAPLKLAAFAAALAVLFGGGALAGAAIGPERDDAPVAADAHTRSQTAGPHREARPEDAEMKNATHETHSASRSSADEHPVRGLAVAEDGLRVVVEDPELRRGQDETLRFRIVDERGATVRDFDVEHEKRMHLIVARRD